MGNNFLVATTKPWNIKLYNERLGNKSNWSLCTDKEHLQEMADTYQPRYIFFPHWSWIIPKSIYCKYECVVFHMTALPYGRGPEPLQHLILAGHQSTVVSAIRVEVGMDAGPVYFKSCEMPLHGNAEEIYTRCAGVVYSMIERMVVACEAGSPMVPKPQVGEPFVFKARTPEDCRMTDTDDLSKVYDEIRMQDALTYTPTFMETNKLRFEFSNAVLRHNCIEAQVIIYPKDKEQDAV